MAKVANAQKLAPTSPVTVLKGVGSQLAAKLEKLGLFTLQDLLFYLPRNYSDRTRVTPIGSLQLHQHVVIEGVVRGTSVVFGKRRSLLCRIQDNTGLISLRFYHFSNAQRANLAEGVSIRCYGEVRRGASGLELYHPEYSLLGNNEKPLEQSLTPIYSVTEGITQKRLRELIHQTLALSKTFSLPYLLSDNTSSDSLFTRLQYLHAPPKDADVSLLMEGEHPYQEALILEELAAYQLSLLRLREKRRQQPAQALTEQADIKDRFIQSLDFSLTSAQARVVEEILSDMQHSAPMMRLVQGDVGSGKTVVAAIAALQAVANQQQVAIMAPTEILAEQHRINFERWFAPLNIRIGWLVGKQKTSERKTQLQQLADHESNIIVGTHALFQDDVVFDQLGLVIIDEQHRFGVHQRLQLRDKAHQQGYLPHQLIMTATPIPRTLAMSAYADLDYSVIDELPKGRIPVETVLISQQKRPAVIERIYHACQEKRQAYWVCTLIEASESLEAQAAEDTAEELKLLLPTLNIGLIHGRLKPAEKEAVMADFKSGAIDLLVATTVIEVGVDVPNASLMVIENPERLGLAQLHQLRGRVGRGSTASHCVLLYGEQLSQHGKERLQAMRQTNDGFKIAEIDLKLRGPGEVLGTRQTGDIDFTIAVLERDAHLLPIARRHAQQLLSDNPATVERLIHRWLGRNENYANV